MVASPLVRALRAAESVRVGDDLAATAQRRIRGILHDTPVDGLLRGAWIGHPVHPLLVTVPIGAWVSAVLLDLTGGQETAARRVVGAGLLSMVPTAVTGWADWSGLDAPRRRVGVLHAAGVAVSGAFLGASYLARRQGRHRAGAVLSLVGALPLAATGALGGHLSYAQGAGVGRWPAASPEAGRTELETSPASSGPVDTGAIPGSGPGLAGTPTQ
jgi:uncharacterized membrane protein